MATKIKRSSKKITAKPNITLPAWIVFWSLVMCTMIMIIVTFTSAIQPILRLSANNQAAFVAQAQ